MCDITSLFLDTRVDLYFTLHKLSKPSSNTGKLCFEGLVHLLIYIRYNNNLGLKYYSRIEDAPLCDLLINYSIKYENQFMVFSDSIWQDCPDTVRSTGAYTLFYHSGPIYHCTIVPVPVAQSSAESYYNSSCTDAY